MGGTGGVLAVVVVIVLVLLLSGNGSPTDTGAYAIPQSAINEVTAVPVNQLVTQAMAVAESTSSNPGALPPEKLPASNPALSVGGKPAFIYMGGEYCPYCAAERWSLVMALSKFGTFSGLKGTTSSATDVDASTPTFSFYGSKFTSRYITFEPVELYKNFGENLTTGVWPTLQKPTAQQQAIFEKYDNTPYVPSSEDAGGIPFVYIGGRYMFVGPQYSTSSLSGKPFDSAANLQTSGTNTASKEAEASAGFLVADICALTHGQPASVCSQVPKALVGYSTSSPRIKTGGAAAKGKSGSGSSKSSSKGTKKAKS